MSGTFLWAVVATVATTLLLWPLAVRDPKRLRASARVNGATGVPMPSRQRSTLGWLALLPGVALSIMGQWPAFLIWLGGIAAIGWAMASTLAPRQKA